MLRLLITNGVQQGRAFRLHPGVNRIGRNVENHFQIPDSSVSGNHCELILSDASVVVRDLDSTNGTYIEGEPVSQANLDTGQKLQLGEIELRLEDTVQSEGGPSVAVPELVMAQRVAAPQLPDGSPACANHPELAAAYRCQKCEQTICGSCVRVIRRLSGDTMAFCSLCNGLCDALEVPVPQPAAAPAEKQSLFGRITERLKLPFKR